MGTIIQFGHRRPRQRGSSGGGQDRTPVDWRSHHAREALPRLLAGLIEAGMEEVAVAAITTWGRGEADPKDILEWCHTYAAVAGLRDVLDHYPQSGAMEEKDQADEGPSN